jgi:hypothetical protein
MQQRSSKQPIHITGALRHCYLWVTSSGGHEVLDNPAYRASIDSADEPTAIICVHGTADRSSAFKLVAERLINQLPDTISSIHLAAFDERGKGKEIEEFSRQLLTTIQNLGIKKVILMGHSRGGLVCAYFAEYLAESAGIHVMSVFGLASPFGGSDKATWPLTWFSTSVAQMAEQSDFLVKLCQKMTQSTIPYYYFAAEKDELVPLSSTYIAGGENQLIILRRHGHLSMMSSWKLVEHLRKRIAGEDCSLSLVTVQSDLGIYIEDFKETFHLFSGDFKEKILTMLSGFFDDIAHDRDDGRYPHAQTISEYILAFLADKTLLQGGGSVMEAVNSPLNTFLQWSNTSTADFLIGLSVRYKDIALPPRARKEMNLELANGTQNRL